MNELDELALYASCGHHLVEIQVDAQELALTMQLIEVAINTIEEENREQILKAFTLIVRAFFEKYFL